MKTILVPIDFSDATDCVVDTAAAVAAAFGSRVILVHVAEPEPQFVGYDPGPMSVRVSVARDIHADQQRLEAVKKKFGAADVLALQVQGSTPEEVLRIAKEQGASLIVIGSHGHGALYHLLVGSVTTGILKGAPCPVLIVPSSPAEKKAEGA